MVGIKMIEAVARELFKQHVDDTLPWEEADEEERETCLDSAHTAIAAYLNAWTPNQSNPVTPVGERLTALLDDDQWNNIEPMLVDVHGEIEALRAQVAALKGCVPAMVAPLYSGDPLPRFGIRWNGPTEPLCVPMDDGYWTPWHYANHRLADCQAVIRHKGHDEDCLATRCRQCSSAENNHLVHGGAFGHEFQAGPCSDACGHDRTTIAEERSDERK